MISATNASRLGKQAKFLDASWFMPSSSRNGRKEFESRRIPCAAFFDIDKVSTESHLPHMMPSPAQLATALSSIGISEDSKIVVYDSGELFSSPRVWYTLVSHGFEAFVLDGGMQAWSDADLPLDTTPAVETSNSSSTLTTRQLSPGAVVSMQEVSDNLSADSPAVVIDARSAGRFTGSEPEPRQGYKSGHIPGSMNVPYSSLVASTGHMKTTPELLKVFEAAVGDISKPHKFILTCGSGVTACVLALGLYRCGVPLSKLSVYDGSWSEWGHPDSTALIEK